MTSPRPAISPPAPPGAWTTFPDTRIERRYRLAHAADDRANARLLLAVAVLAASVFALTDLQQPSGVSLLLTVRAVAVLAGLALLVWLRRPRPVAAVDRLLFAWGLAVAVWQAVVQVYRPPGHLGPTTATLCSLVLIYLVLPLPLWRLAMIGTLQVAGCLVVAMWVNPIADWTALRSLIVWTLGLNLVGWTTARRLQTRSRLLFLAAAAQAELTAILEQTLAEVKTLRGLIRICAWCKHVHADGEWQQVEQYVSANSHAEFTHGICPACLAEQIRPATASPGCGR